MSKLIREGNADIKSGFGRYDVMIEPKDTEKDAIILEFKVHDAEDEKTLEDTESRQSISANTVLLLRGKRC